MVIVETLHSDHWTVELGDPGNIISSCSIVDCRMRMGTATFEVAGIGGVDTRPEYRQRGYGRRVVDASLKLMRREDYLVPFLHGIQDFHNRFGFITCMTEHAFSVTTRDAERSKGNLRTRKMREADLPAITRIYNHDNAQRTGSAVRQAGRFNGFDKGSGWDIPAVTQVIIDNEDNVSDYMVYNDVQYECRASEVGGQGRELFRTILAFLARRVLLLRREHLWVNAPDDHPFAIYCRDFGMRLRTLYPRNEKAMRIIDLNACFQAILPDLSRRWDPQQRNQNLSFYTDIGRVAVG